MAGMKQAPAPSRMNRKKTFESDLARLRGGTLPSKTSWDSETFQQVVQWYHLSLYRYYAIHTNGDLHFAKNLTGETFSVVYHKPVSFEKGTFSSWFFGLAWDVLHEHYARPGSEMRRSKGLSADRSTGHEPGPNHTELLAILKILSTLTFYSRETLCLRLFAELSIKEIAMLMDKRPVTVKTLVYQGMTEFASRMEVSNPLFSHGSNSFRLHGLIIFIL